MAWDNLEPICSSVHPPLRVFSICSGAKKKKTNTISLNADDHKLQPKETTVLLKSDTLCISADDGRIPWVQRSLGAPFHQEAGRGTPEAELGTGEEEDCRLAKPQMWEHCCSRRGRLPPSWGHTRRGEGRIYMTRRLFVTCHNSCLFLGRQCFPNNPKTGNAADVEFNVATKYPGFIKVYLPEAMWFRGKVVGGQQVSRRNTGTLTDAVALLGPEHHLDFLKRKHTSSYDTDTQFVHCKYFQFIPGGSSQLHSTNSGRMQWN